MNILYAGSPDISAKVLEDLYLLTKDSSDFKIVGVLTNPPSLKYVSVLINKVEIPQNEIPAISANAIKI